MSGKHERREYTNTLSYELTKAGGRRRNEQELIRSAGLRDECGRLPRPPRLRDAIHNFDEMLWKNVNDAIRSTAGLLYCDDEEPPFCEHREQFFCDHLFYRQRLLGRSASEYFPHWREFASVAQLMGDAASKQDHCQCRDNRSVVVGKRGWLECRLLSVRCYGRIHRIPFIVTMAKKCRLPAASNGELVGLLDAEPTNYKQLIDVTKSFEA